MRYLYGDSVPFPPQYDLLAALKIFVEHASTAARVDAEGRAAVASAETDAAARARSVESLESTHAAVMQFVGSATTGGQPLIADYARRVQESAAAFVVAAKQEAASFGQQARDMARAKSDQGRATARGCLETILIALRLPVSGSRIVMDLEDGKNEFQTAHDHPEGIATSFSLALDMVPEWQKPRRVSDLAQGVTLPVGLKRSLFKRTLSHEPVTLDDFYLGGFDLEDETVLLKLRRKPDQKDVLVFKMRHTDAGYMAEVEHPGESGAEALDPVLDPQATTELERFVTLLRSACGPAVAHKGRLLGVTLRGHDVLEEGSVAQLLSTLVALLSPTVAEISRRSASPLELTLKTEDDEGRRQEVYVKKAELFAKLDTVPDAARATFERLRHALEARPETPPPPSVR